MFCFRLWHQLTLKLETFVRTPELQKGEQLIDIYNKFISTFETKYVGVCFVVLIKIKNVFSY